MSIKRARAAIVTINDFNASEKAVRTLRAISSTLPVIARSSDIDQLLLLESAGADLAISEKLEAGLQLGGALLRALGLAEMEISRVLDIFRAADYSRTREGEIKTE